jgi:hypothetical protein
MKKLYIRLFSDKNNQVPVNSEFVCNLGTFGFMKVELYEQTANIASWMIDNPNGKVDFVIL